ncbi:ArsR family transcription regulator [Natrialba magadii ATCC 43099]|uniref:ArsR family transcription regulator n=1 Tax=Natrialba magadii (strain ATCC 43099 / DSM 3394 / CCM 3739 / CIP 104546 / IAM 13178 / JCM 8861 / NBRC 102185 / NCIMB 2190 / MS3) TaxID=547559 RepID=D3SUM4_NATMM|nr:helix-turn-helix domain-containing protein [Natrialba magadii]ADD05282.1 ArsR family transcription regulator [Natrialba magadii ATCC 43099]ELY29170.1 regulatory protein ArsR [Natrialba magadii ATCC 43099]
MDRLAGRLVRRFREDADEPAVVGLEGEDADQLFDALGSETSRAVLAACYAEGRTRSELAAELETSLQNVGYHVDKLESADLLEPVETRYGENGREVTVYEPSKQAVVIAAGEPGFVERLAAAVDRLFAPIALVSLVALVVGVLVREPARIGMLAGDDAGTVDTATTTTTTTTTAVSPAVTVAVATFLLGLLVVLVADRRGVFGQDRDWEGGRGNNRADCIRDHDHARADCPRTRNHDRANRAGTAKLLVGRQPDLTKRYATVILAGSLATFLVLDLAAIGTGRWLTLASWIVVQWAIPAWLFAAVAVAASNDGLFASWGVASVPFVGIWGYLVAGDIVRGGPDTILLALGPAIVVLVAMPLGSVAYLVGRFIATRRRAVTLPARRTLAIILAHPVAAVAILAAWLSVIG